MRTVVTYLDKNKNRTTKENAWTVMTQVYNDAGNLQRTGYSLGEAQIQASAAANEAMMLRLRDTESSELIRFSKSLVKVGRNDDCDIVFSKKEDKKKIDKVHAAFELRQGVWYVIDYSKAGTWVNSERISANIPHSLGSGDVIDFGGRRKLELL